MITPCLMITYTYLMITPRLMITICVMITACVMIMLIEITDAVTCVLVHYNSIVCKSSTICFTVLRADPQFTAQQSASQSVSQSVSQLSSLIHSVDLPHYRISNARSNRNLSAEKRCVFLAEQVEQLVDSPTINI